MTITKQQGTIITAVTAVLFGCSGILTCIGAFLTIPVSTIPYEITSWVWVATNICSALAFLSLPVIFYFVLVANNKNEPDLLLPENKDGPST
jgi:hypothetical protein